MSGPFDFKFVSPEEYHRTVLDPPPLSDLLRRAESDDVCENCGAHVWRLAGLGLCFPCVTGESDASDDYEIGEPYYE